MSISLPDNMPNIFHSVYLSTCLSVLYTIFPIDLPLCQFVYLFVCPLHNLSSTSFSLSFCISVCLYIRHLSIFESHMSIHLSTSLSIYPNVRLSICPSVRLSICPSVRLSVCLSVCRWQRLNDGFGKRYSTGTQSIVKFPIIH